MPTVHTSAFIEPQDVIISASAHVGRIAVATVKMRDPDGKSSEIKVFADRLDQLTAFFRAGLAECEGLMAPNHADESAVTHDFRPGAYAVASAEPLPPRNYEEWVKQQPNARNEGPAGTTLQAVAAEQTPAITTQTVVECLDFDGKVCHVCRQPATHKAYHQYLCKTHFDEIPF